MEGSFKMIKVLMVRNKKQGEKMTQEGLKAINYVVYSMLFFAIKASNIFFLFIRDHTHFK